MTRKSPTAQHITYLTPTNVSGAGVPDPFHYVAGGNALPEGDHKK